MDIKWTVMFGALGLIACLYAWRTPLRPVGIALALNVTITTLVTALCGIAPLIAANALVEIIVMLCAFACLFDTRGVPLVVISLSLASCIVSLGFGQAGNPTSLRTYQETVNTIYAANCFITIMTGMLSVVGTRAGSFFRWRRYRRRAADAHRRFQLASPPPDPFG